MGRVLAIVTNEETREAQAAMEAAGADHDGLIVRFEPNASIAVETAHDFRPDLVVVSAAIPDADHLVSEMRAVHRSVSALLVGETTGDSLSLASHAGVDAVLVRPLDPLSMRRILVQEGPATKARGTQNTAHLPAIVVGSTPQMREVWRFVLLAAQSSSSVVIIGETGVGKEVVARALHRFSARRSGPFIAVNCAALPATLLESELFGHEKGSFTGAVTQHKGRFELAHGGTLFLDEIGDLPLDVQVKLLRVLQEHSFERVGGTQSIPVDVRIVAATHARLEEEVLRGRFRADLFYRLSVLSVEVPPLRERKGDLLALWRNFIEEAALVERRAHPPTSRAVERLLLRHDWPGNVRELHNAAEHAMAVTTGTRVMPADLPSYLTRGEGPAAKTSYGLVGLTLREIERIAILETWESIGTVKATAEMLGISERKAHYRIKEYREGGMLPQPSEVIVPHRPSPGSEEGPAVHDRIRVLLAEDDDELRWALTDFLKGEGYEVIAVPNGSALLTHLGAAFLLEQRDEPPDVIVTDVRMPGISGMHILESVRARAWNIPVVLISAFADAETRAHAKALGVTALLEKPIDKERLRQVIQDSVVGVAHQHQH